ncbi:MAG: 5'-3' exonuclease H3TH domain-containing protein, partial [Lactobacillaceae bacterium]
MAKRADEAGWETTIVTGDRDLTQLTTDRTTVQVTVKGVNELEAYTPAHVKEKLGITPAQIIDLKGLMGDTSDNYPGVTKVGEKTALKLLNQYGSMENLYANVDDMKKSKLKENLINDKDNAFLSKQLATIDRDAPLTVDLADVTYAGPDLDKLWDFYTKMNMNSLLKKIGGSVAKPVQAVHFSVLDEQSILALTKLTEPLTFEIEMLEDNYHVAEQIGFFIGTKEETYVSTDVTLLTLPAVKRWLEDAKRDLTVFDGKRNIVAANRLGVKLPDIAFDVLLASYLINPDDNSNDLGKIAEDHDYHDLPRDEDIYGKGAKRQVPEDDKLFGQFARKSDALFALRPDLTGDLEKQEQTDLFTDMEMPLSRVLAEMEIQGITLNAKTLKAMGTEFSQ